MVKLMRLQIDIDISDIIDNNKDDDDDDNKTMRMSYLVVNLSLVHSHRLWEKFSL